MLQALSSYFQSPAIDKLESLYGGRLQQLSTAELLALILTLSDACLTVHRGEDSDPLDTMFEDITFDSESSPDLIAILHQLDGELTDVSQGISLLQGLTTIAAARPVPADEA